MPNYVSILDNITYTLLNGGSQYLSDEDVWFFDYHLSKPHTVGNIAYVPRFNLNQIDPVFHEADTSSLAEDLKLATNKYYMTSDYTKGVFLFSKTTKNLYYLDIPTATVTELAKTGVIPNLVEGSAFLGKLLEYRPVTNWVFYANTADQVLYQYDVSGTIWSARSSFPTGWSINSNISKEVTLLVDQVTNDLYMMTRNLFVQSQAQQTIYYNYRLFKYDLVANIWQERLSENSIDLFQYGIITAETPHSTGRCMIHNGKLYVFNLFTEVFPGGAKGRNSYLVFLIINISNGAIEKNDYIPFYQQNLTQNFPMQAVRYGSSMALITPDVPEASMLIDPITQGISYLRVDLGTAQGTNTIRTDSVYCLGAVPASEQIYDPRERKEYPLSWTNAELVADYSFADQIYTDTIQFYTNDSDGIDIYIDTGTGSYTQATTSYNAQSQVLSAEVGTYLKRFRISYTIGSGNADSELYRIEVLADPTHVWILNSANNRLDNDQFSNIIIGTPTVSRLYKVQNKTGFTATAVRIFIEADGDTGSYYTQISTQSDSGFIGHCTANSGTTCTKGFSFGTRNCASGRCGGYEKSTLLPSPQALPPNQSAIFYVRVNVPAGETRVNRQARVITQIEY
jgi:hypothetical protein